jgi:hypothetical protein
MSALFGLTGLAEMDAGLPILFAIGLFLILVIVTLVALIFRSRGAVVTCLFLIPILGLIVAALCSSSVDPNSYQGMDSDCIGAARVDRMFGTILARGLICFMPVVILAAVRAFGDKPPAGS